jgi:hypothetical protein
LSIAPPLSLFLRRASRDILAPEHDRCCLDGTMMVASVDELEVLRRELKHARRWPG